MTRAEEQKLHYYQRLASGQCVRCGRDKKTTQKSYCFKCLLYFTARRNSKNVTETVQPTPLVVDSLQQ